jgi:hypothetical protein
MVVTLKLDLFIFFICYGLAIDGCVLNQDQMTSFES